MLPSSVDTPQEPEVALIGCLDAGQTGCLTGRTASDARFRVYVMLGEILAAHALDDDARMLGRLRALGAVDTQQEAALVDRLISGASLPELLIEVVPEGLLLEVLFERFRENLFQFLLSEGIGEFQSLEAVFTDNIQVGHDSRVLLDELVALRDRVAPLLREDPTLAPGPVPVEQPEQAAIRHRCVPPTPLSRLTASGPSEPGRVLDVVERMLGLGMLSVVAPAPVDDESVADEDTADAVLPFNRLRGQSQRQVESPVHKPGWDVPDDELAAFQDYDTSRGDDGAFTSDFATLDRVELIDTVRREPLPASTETLIEMEEGDSKDIKGAVSLNFSGPKLEEDEAERKLDVINDVLATISAALEQKEGRGSGQARLQLLLESTPVAMAPLFKGVEVSADGRMPIARVMRNLRKRPVGEHRRLLNRGLSDLVERAISLSNELLDEEGIEAMLEQIAGYQHRLGI